MSPQPKRAMRSVGLACSVAEDAGPESINRRALVRRQEEASVSARRLCPTGSEGAGGWQHEGGHPRRGMTSRIEPRLRRAMSRASDRTSPSFADRRRDRRDQRPRAGRLPGFRGTPPRRSRAITAVFGIGVLERRDMRTQHPQFLLADLFDRHNRAAPDEPSSTIRPPLPAAAAASSSAVGSPVASITTGAARLAMRSVSSTVRNSVAPPARACISFS